jgi:hypothetical protein
MNLILEHWQRYRLRGAVVLGSLLLLCIPTASAEELQQSGEFKGHWTATGTAETLVLDESRSASILRIRGTIAIESPDGLPRALQSDCVGLNLNEEPPTGNGRCVWTDSDGDRLISELSGELTATDSKVLGRFIGGTGKYAGLEGSYELEWRYLRTIEAEGTIHG